MASNPTTPPKVIPGLIPLGQLSVAVSYDNPSSIYDGFPYIYSASITVNPELNSDFNIIPIGGQWGADNITTDMFYGTQAGQVFKVINVDITSSTSCTVVLEDQDLFVLNSDPQQFGGNAPLESTYGIFFNIDEEGQPILGTITSVSTLFQENSYWIDDITGRFRARDYRQKYFAIDNLSTDYTGIQTGSFVYLSSSGEFYTASTGNDLERLFGIVQEKNTPETGNMYVRPIAKIVENLPILPG
jgi:hypothetical protein